MLKGKRKFQKKEGGKRKGGSVKVFGNRISGFKYQLSLTSYETLAKLLRLSSPRGWEEKDKGIYQLSYPKIGTVVLTENNTYT